MHFLNIFFKKFILFLISLNVDKPEDKITFFLVLRLASASQGFEKNCGEAIFKSDILYLIANLSVVNEVMLKKI